MSSCRTAVQVQVLALIRGWLQEGGEQVEVACEHSNTRAWSERRGEELTDPVTIQLFLTTNLAARTAEEITKTHSHM